MKRTFLRTVLIVVLLLLAVVLGQVIGEACGNISFLSWLAINVQFGLNPTVINLHVIELTFGIVVNFNVAQAIFLLFAIIAYSRIKIAD